MKQFLKRIFLFALFLSSILFLLKSLVPFYWGHEILKEKLDYYLQHSDDYNTVAIGSSLLYRHFIPSLFDEMTEETTRSFNLGAGRLFFQEAYFVADQLLKKDIPLENMIFFVRGPVRIAHLNVHTLGANYYMDFKRLMFNLKYYHDNRQQINYHIYSYLEKLFCIGQIESMIRYILDDSKPAEVLVADHGYYSLDDEFEDAPTVELHARKNQYAKYLRETKLQKNNEPEVLTHRQIKIREALRKKKMEITKSDLVFINALKDINAKAEERNVNCIFIIYLNESLNEKIDGIKKIPLLRGITFPEFGNPEYHFDQHHLNHKGAQAFTRRVAEKFKEF